MSIKASRFYGMGLALVAVSAFAACSEEDPNTNNNTAGTSSSAGTGTAGSGSAGTPSTGGTPGAGGSGTAGSGTAGSGTAGSGTAGSGGAGMGPFACAATKPSSSLITGFEDLMPAPTAGQFVFMLGIPGGTFAYGGEVVSDATKKLNIKGSVSGYHGFGLYFNECTDAGTAGTTGISFKIKGTLGTKTTLNFRVQTNSTAAIDPTNKKGACPLPAGRGPADAYPDCQSAAKDIMVGAAEAEVKVLWTELMGGMKANAPTAFDPKEITAMEWAFPWAGMTDTAYDADVTIDDVQFIGGTFTGGGTGAGGSSGAGGGGAGGAGAGAGGGGTGGGGAAP